MKENDNGNDRVSVCGGRLTRSQAAPDWSVTESLILVNEIAAVEADCSTALSSYQLWNIIAGNCSALGVGRNLSQCRRKWDALLSEYDKITCSHRARANANKLGLPQNFDPELFKAIDRVVKAREERGEVEPQSDPEPGNEEARDLTVEIGSKRKRQRSKSERYHAEKPKKCMPVESLEKLCEEQDQRGFLEQRPVESHEEEPENHHLEEEYLKDFLEEKPKLKCTAEKPPKGNIEIPLKSLAEVELHENHGIERPKPTGVENITICREENEEIMTLKLQELAVEIEAIASESANYKVAGPQNVEDYHTEFTRRQGDKLIASLGSFSSTLKQLCDLLQECN
ncbi:uncharacterized protein LOC133306267 [Gastrolobium bilobum]|uniref:uncharacterized protein LOC133306267 n=1 Tax=Gastrolobium bilobum TaxID=150636 RepID=UPI002AAF475C|nr:uncharacterized protein LOC133306267 [Gastrolobium bilobum]